MESYVSRQQVREINRKLFANDIFYSGEETDKNTFEILVSNIIQRYNPEDALENVPTILEVKEDNITRNVLDKLYLLNKDSVYVQFNNRVLADKEKVDIIRELKESGYKIVIEINEEDTIFTLAKVLADIVKFDIQHIPPALNDKNNRFQCKTLAYNVDTDADYVLAEASGITLYEGTYISSATEVAVNTKSHSNVNFIEIIALINDNKSDIDSISKTISRDSLMSAQVIRLANSAYFGSRNRIASIKDAVIRVGLSNLKRWIFLLQFNKNNNVSEELLQTSYQRAVFCERIAKESKKMKLDSGDAYLIGLFSTLEVLTGRPIDKELYSMNLHEEVEEAIIYRDGEGGQLLNLVVAYEEANWKRVERYTDKFGLNKDKMYKIYFNAIDEVTKLWQNLTSLGNIY